MTERYMTVGEVADRLGITVRSIQYYDQQGVLSPSAKGPQNQRLYTQEDVLRLQEVACLKYAGLSLSQIRDIMADSGTSGTPDEVAGLFEDAVFETEKGFSALLRRHETLRSLVNALKEASRAGRDPDWAALARTIESKRDEGRFFWRLSCLYEDEGADEENGLKAVPGQAEEDHELLAEWHSVMADCVSLLRSREPIDSPRSRSVARHVIELRAKDDRSSDGRGFLIIENAPMEHHPDSKSFDNLRQELGDYLDRLVEAYCASEGPHGEVDEEEPGGQREDHR